MTHLIDSRALEGVRSPNCLGSTALGLGSPNFLGSMGADGLTSRRDPISVSDT
jgi:hypothetical protein